MLLSDLPNYELHNQIYETAKSLIYRGRRVHDNLPVVIKIQKNSLPTPQELIFYRQEFDITNKINSNGTITAYELQKYHNRLFIVLEDINGESLKNILQQSAVPFFIPSFLSIAITITQTLAEIHASQVIHKDINPANIIWNQQTNQLKVIDFSISSVLLREVTSLKNPEQLEGTLPYIAPEQTGRMNCSLDYRADLYSLGITFYELLTKKLPFDSKEPLELVHCHIAKSVTPPHEINPDIPYILSKLIMKLLAKNAENRYQSALGLKHDLTICLAYIDDLQQLDFLLAQQDFSNQFNIPQKLYGRETEINQLLQSFERVAQGNTELMLVKGYSGVGKTSLVNAVHLPMTQKHGYFASGKFDQYQRNTPYSAITQAFEDFCDYLLSGNLQVLAQWKQKILDAVGQNGQVLIDVIPSLEYIIGKQPAVAELTSARAAHNRFNVSFQHFMRAICQAEHPLVLFIDDWQWADSASLNLLQLLLTDSELHHLLVIAAYRTNEVDESHLFQITLNKLYKQQQQIYQVELDNLAEQDVTELLIDTLHDNNVSELSRLLYEKTLGNAFFVINFLKTLYEEDLLNFNVTRQCWVWNINKIALKTLADNVVELMTDKIRKQTSQTQKVLQLAASIGNKFDLQTLSIIFKHNIYNTFNVLWPAIEQGFIIPLNDKYKLLENAEHASSAAFKFQHDRIQQAAYALVPDTEKQILHLHIGRLLLKHNVKEENLFSIVQQFNYSLNLISDYKEKITVAKLNLQAGQRAIDEAAYISAITYFQAAQRVTDDNWWETDYQLILDIYVYSVKAALLATDYEQAQYLTQIVLRYAKTDLDKVRIYEYELLFYAVKNRVKDSVYLGHKILNKLGFSLKQTPPEQQDLQVYENLPDMTDPTSLFMYRILISIYVPSFHIDPKLGMQTAFTMLQLQLDKGNSPKAAYIYAFYGVLCCGQLNIDTGYRFGQMALRLLDKYQDKESLCKVLTAYNAQIKPWKKPFRACLTPLKQAIQTGFEIGDLEFMGYAAMHYCSGMFLCGKPLTEVAEEIPAYVKMARKNQHPFPESYLSLWGQLTHNLLGKTNNIFILKGKFIDIFQLEQSQYYTSPLKFTNLFAQTIIYYLFEQYEAALDCAEQLEDLGKTLMGVTVPSQSYYYYSLVALALYPQASDKLQLHLATTIERYQQRLAKWAQFAPVNFQHKYDLVEAERAKIREDYWQACKFYEKAIKGAKQNEFLHDEALANELAAKFYHQHGMGKIACLYFREAHYHYIHWGAKPKAEKLKNDYNVYFIDSNTSHIEQQTTTHLSISSQATQYATSQLLDLTSILQASQILSSEIKLNKLLIAMMNIVIKNAGADKGFLLLPKQNEWFIQAEAFANREQVSVLQSINIEQSTLLSNAIINIVLRKQHCIVLPKDKHKFDFRNDTYLQQVNPKSVLCIPLLNRSNLVAILYLENTKTEHAFTENHLQILQLLSSQIAISIENAQFYAELEIKVEERTAALKKQNIILEDLNREKNAMLGITAHDLKNPIGIVRGYAEEIEEFADEMSLDEIIDLMGKIKYTANQMLELINNLLDVNALESGKLNINVQQYDILIVYRELYTIYRQRGLQKNITVYDKSTAIQCIAYVDKTAIRQILDNLISNAVKYSPANRNVYLYLDNIEEKQIVRFEVKDEGPGLSAADQAKLFLKTLKKFVSH